MSFFFFLEIMKFEMEKMMEKFLNAIIFLNKI